MEAILDSYFNNIEDITQYSRDQIYMDVHDEPEIMNADYNKVMNEIDKRIRKLLPEVKGGMSQKIKLIIIISAILIVVVIVAILFVCLSGKQEVSLHDSSLKKQYK